MSPEVSVENETRLARVAREVRALFERIDADTSALRASSGLSCPSGCGACCENPHIEATVAELLPAALLLLERGEAEGVFEREEVREGKGRCVFYASEGAGRGHCSRYATRPAVCRLFGFAAVRTRRGPELALCRVHRASEPEGSERALRLVLEGARAGDFPAAGAALAALDPQLGIELMPLNAALREALGRVLFERDMREAEKVVSLFAKTSPTEPPNDDEPSPTPNMPAVA